MSAVVLLHTVRKVIPMQYDNEMVGKTIGKSTWTPPEKAEWVSVEISDEEIRRILEERPGGRKAGRGDSPFTKEFYEETYGIEKEGKE